MEVVVLNIGLDGVTPSEGYTNGRRNPVISAKAFAVVQALRQHGFVYFANKVVVSDTEPTLTIEVAQVAGAQAPLHGAIRGVAAALNQDTIACWKPKRQHGVMLGRDIDHDDTYGPFDPHLFFMPDGDRLASAVAAAA
jgi:hypothetical protein